MKRKPAAERDRAPLTAKQEIKEAQRAPTSKRRAPMKRGAPLKRKTALKRSQGFREQRAGHNFRAKRSSDEHGHYDSKAERERFHHLLLLQRIGDISDLELHPAKITLLAADKKRNLPAISFRPDYRYREDGRWIFEDCKPRPAERYERLIWRLWMHFGAAPLRISKRSKGGKDWVIDKTIYPARAMPADAE